MSGDLNGNILLVGTGTMGLEYAKVLKALHISFIAVGRSDDSVQEFIKKTNEQAISGGLNSFIETQINLPGQAIVTVSIEQLGPVTSALLHRGVKRILVEKPAGLNPEEIGDIAFLAKSYNAEVYVAYNRRFFSSVIKAKEIIEEDGGVTSFFFEFTEWSHILSKSAKPIEVLNQIFLANSTHVVDMAFFLGGIPEHLSCFTAGQLEWHPKASAFAGAGITENGAPFSYHANWASPGRWGVEVLTNRHRLIFRPLEKLMLQRIGELDIQPVELDDELDRVYKPGLYRQVEAFIFQRHSEKLLSIAQHNNLVLKVYGKILSPLDDRF